VKITFPLFPAAGPTDVATAHAAIATTVENERVLASWCAPSTGDRKAATFICRSEARPASIKSDRVIRSLYERQTPDLAVAHKIFGTPRILGSNLIGDAHEGAIVELCDGTGSVDTVHSTILRINPDAHSILHIDAPAFRP
jgi:hypothetical protein